MSLNVCVKFFIFQFWFWKTKLVFKRKRGSNAKQCSNSACFYIESLSYTLVQTINWFSGYPKNWRNSSFGLCVFSETWFRKLFTLRCDMITSCLHKEALSFWVEFGSFWNVLLIVLRHFDTDKYRANGKVVGVCERRESFQK